MIEFYVAIVVLAICLFFKWQLSFWTRKGIDGPSPIPICGNLYEYVVKRKHFAEVFDDIYKSYPTANYVGIFNMNTPFLLIRDLDLVKNVLVKDFDSFSENWFALDEKVDPLFAVNPFITHGEKWKTDRSHVSPILTMAKIKPLIPLIEDVANKMLEYIDCGPESNDPNGIEAKNVCGKFTTDVVASCAFGMKGESFTNPNSPFHQINNSLFASDFMTTLRSSLALFMPSLTKMLGLPFISPVADAKMRSIMKQILDHRATNPEVRVDFLEGLLKLREKHGDVEYDETKIIGLSLMFLVEGFETSSTLMAFCLYELAMNPQIQKQVQDEIDTVMAKNDQKLTIECLQQMTYLAQVMNETLRIHPPAMDLKKIVTKPYKIPPQYQSVDAKKEVVLAPGTVVNVPIYSIQLDPKYYPEPTKFDPNRFSEENAKKHEKYSFLAFGEGPRICLGMKFGLIQSKLGLVKLLANYDVTFSPKMKLPITMAKTIFVLTSEHGIWLNLKKRSNTGN